MALVGIWRVDFINSALMQPAMHLPADTPPAGEHATDEGTFRRYQTALLAGDRQQCRAIFEGWLRSDPDLHQLYEQIIQRSLYEVGQLWEAGKVSVATEHLATAITESLLNLVYPRLFSQPRLGKSAVVTCTANEYHQIGGKMVADVFELNGWRGYFLGANTPPADLLNLVREKQPDVVTLSLTVYFNLESLLETARKVRAEFPAMPILVGGQAFRWGGRERVAEVPGVRCLTSLVDLEQWIKSGGGHAA